ncbi:hypothetical protein ACK2IE_18460 [Clostridioides difficile]|nr:hypothetical protein [Clostridioides difficile]WPV44439.1 hypothetical protein CDIFJ21_12330 [Clostridioides difficile]
MNREKLVAFIRYLSLFILVVSYLKNVENTLYPVITMIILFLIIINNQVRFFLYQMRINLYLFLTF